VHDSATALADAIEAAIPAWVVRSVDRLVTAYTGAPPDADTRTRARAAGERAARDVGERVRALLRRDIDDQRDTPLTIIRAHAVPYATDVLTGAGVPAVVRDDFKERAFPDDRYDLTPAGWTDVDESLQAPGMAWGAWKATAHRQRHAG
jgi:hypothetical protein